MAVKDCVSCGESKDVTLFGSADGMVGARRDCKDCANAASKRSRNKGKGGGDDLKLVVAGLVKGNAKVTAAVAGYVALSDTDKALFRVVAGLGK